MGNNDSRPNRVHKENQKFRRCPECNGQGRVQVWVSTCDKCMGTGRACPPGGGIDIFTPCPYCNGSGQRGRIEWELCRRCMGHGQIN